MTVTLFLDIDMSVSSRFEAFCWGAFISRKVCGLALGTKRPKPSRIRHLQNARHQQIKDRFIII